MCTVIMRCHDAVFAIRRCFNDCTLCLGGDSVTDGTVLSVSRGEDEELDVDSVLTALREFQQEFRDTQRERVYLNFLITELRLMDTNLSNSEWVGLLIESSTTLN